MKELHMPPIHISYRKPYELLHSYREIFGREIYRFHAVSSTPVIIDCGSNIGLSVLYFKSLYPQARVIAFEPDPGNFNLLQMNLTSNKIDGVTLHQEAVWTSNGTVTFNAASSEASHITEMTTGVSVPARRLKEVLAEEGTIDFLKIDIEGAEYPVLQDCVAELEKVNHLFLEYHGLSRETAKLSDLLAIVKNAGFQLYIRNAADNLQYPFLDKNTGTIYDVQLNLFCYK